MFDEPDPLVVVVVVGVSGLPPTPPVEVVAGGTLAKFCPVVWVVVCFGVWVVRAGVGFGTETDVCVGSVDLVCSSSASLSSRVSSLGVELGCSDTCSGSVSMVVLESVSGIRLVASLVTSSRILAKERFSPYLASIYEYEANVIPMMITSETISLYGRRVLGLYSSSGLNDGLTTAWTGCGVSLGILSLETVASL